MKSKTRQLIIDTASELFYTRGYNLTGINEIIDKAGIAKATLYSHFKSKDELCVAYLEERDLELLAQLKTFCYDKPKGNKQLVALLEFLLSFFNSTEFNGCWCIRTIAEIPRENTLIRDKIKEQKTIFKKFIEALVVENKPQLSKAKQLQLANQIYLLYEGAISESHLHREQWPIDNAIEMLKEIME